MKQAIVIIGGYNSLWPVYLRVARYLEDVSGLQAVGVPLMPWHWWAADRAGEAGNILGKVQETVTWARRRFGADRFVLVGHSAGGLIARLYLCRQAVWGRVYAGVEFVDRVITLGSPHCGDRGSEMGWYLADEANRLAPGTAYAGEVEYLAVAGRSVLGRKYGSRAERRAYRAYRYMTGQGNTWGDGIVPVHSARLDGAGRLTLPGIAHSLKVDRNWYGGSKAIVGGWWFAGADDAG
jgi:pimeloyl-ACP methyl ester carboxylesterase